MILLSRLHLNSSLTCLVPYDWTVTDAKQHRGRTVTDAKQHRGRTVTDAKQHRGRTVTDAKQHRGRMQGRLYITGST